VLSVKQAAERLGISVSLMYALVSTRKTGIAKVVSGQQDPGRRLLETIVENTKVSPAWLYAGEGPVLRGSGIPVATACLPGPPVEHNQVREEGVPELGDLYSPSRYWLKLGAREPAVMVSGTRLEAGDMLLMETQRSLFPTPDQMDARWCVVRLPGRKESKLRLARLSQVSESQDNGVAHLEAETFEAYPLVVDRTVIEEFPDGVVKVVKHKVRYERPAAGKLDDAEALEPWTSSILPRPVEVTDIIALCVLVVRRFG
jgi:hypothetical protein